MSSVTGLSAEAIATLVRKCPHLLSCNSDTIALKFKGIKELVQRPHEEVRGQEVVPALFKSHPTPWSLNPPLLGSAQVVSMILETPQLLFLNTQSLEVKFNELCSVMGMSPERIGEIASARPMLLTSSTQTLKVSHMDCYPGRAGLPHFFVLHHCRAVLCLCRSAGPPCRV